MTDAETARERPPGPAKPPAWYAENPFAKMSFTRLSVFRRCPAWYRHSYLDWHRSWSHPVQRAGHAVQGVLEKVFDLRPAEDVTLETVEARALERANRLFDEAWEQERAAHAADANGVGDWDLPKERYQGYVAQGLRFHLNEVRARLGGRHPTTGAPLACGPAPSVTAAWIAVRPWHPVKSAEDDLALETIPAGWFQGQYDLVYSWTGRRRIVDLKASGGRGLFATEIRDQLLGYSWMERESGRPDPEGIEGWFLGRPVPEILDPPSAPELDAFGAEVLALIELSGSERGFGSWRPDDFPAAPKPVPGFPAAEGEPSAWCGFCPASHTCPKSRRTAPPRGEGIDFGSDPGRGTAAEGLVLGVGESRVKNDRPRRKITLANESGVRTFQWDTSDVVRLARQGLRAGRVVRVSNLKRWDPPRGGDPMWFSSPATTLKVLSPAWEGLPEDPEASRG